MRRLGVFSAVPQLMVIIGSSLQFPGVLCNSAYSSLLMVIRGGQTFSAIPELNRTWATRCNYGDNVRTAAIIMVIMWQL